MHNFEGYLFESQNVDFLFPTSLMKRQRSGMEEKISTEMLEDYPHDY